MVHAVPQGSSHQRERAGLLHHHQGVPQTPKKNKGEKKKKANVFTPIPILLSLTIYLSHINILKMALWVKRSGSFQANGANERH